MYKIGVVSLYFGKVPNYFPSFIKSVSYNKTVDFFLITDDVDCYNRFGSYCNNFKIIYSSFADIVSTIKSKIFSSAKINTPYKLCDVKIMYGTLFSELFDRYDFWGFCDLDIVFGNIRKFLTNSILDTYDRLSLFGHFQVFRNCEFINSLYKMLDYKRILSSDASFASDEYLLTNKCNELNIKQYDFRDIICDVNFLSYTFENCHISSFNLKKYYIEFNKGQLFCLNNSLKIELLYVHFQKRKFVYNVDDEELFYIYPNFFSNNRPLKRQFTTNKPIYNFSKRIKEYKRRFKNKLKRN